MARPLMISALVAMPLVGGLVGLHLGRSTVAEINPAYFRSQEVRFHSDLVADRPADWTNAPPARPIDASLIQGLGSGCVKCIDYPEEYRPAHMLSFDDVSAWTETPPDVAVPPVAAGATTEEPEVPRTDVALYAYYVITEEVGQQSKVDEKSEPAVSSGPILAGETNDQGSH